MSNFYHLYQINAHLEEFTQGNEIQTVGTVEHNTLLGHGLGKILGCLSLSCTSWTFWGATQMKL
jgi:hypothetical protein